MPPGLKLESEAALLQPGRKDGEMKVIREGGSGVVYSWNAARLVATLPGPCLIQPHKAETGQGPSVPLRQHLLRQRARSDG